MVVRTTCATTSNNGGNVVVGLNTHWSMYRSWSQSVLLTECQVVNYPLTEELAYI